MNELLLMVAVIALSACDESQVWHTPDPSVARMLDQPRGDPYGPEMREPPPGTVPALSDESTRPELSEELLSLGRSAFNDTCAACHGVVGDGDSVVASKMTVRRPPSLLAPPATALSVSELYNVATFGYGLMPPYSAQLSLRERWGVVAYVRALQLSQHAELTSLPPEVRNDFEKAVLESAVQ